MNRVRRAGAHVAAAGALIAALMASGLSPADAQTTLCKGVTVAEVAACDTSGYAAVMNTSHWGMTKGHNCTNYVAYRLGKNGVPRPSRQMGSANAWASNARALGYPVTKTPAVGAVATYGARNHIAYVEEVGPGYLVLSEDHYPGYYPQGQFQKIKVFVGDSWYPQEFIHFRPAPISDGEFVVENGYVYRVVGGAPVYVKSFAPFGGQPPLRWITRSELQALRATPRDGTIVHGATSGRVFVFAGGAPQYVSAWDRIGGARPSIAVDDYTLDRPSQAPHLTSVAPVPADGTMLVGTTGRVFIVAGGAPQYVSSFAAVGGQRAFTRVDDWVLDNAGGTGTAQYLRAHPADGTMLVGTTGRVFIVAGGAPQYVSSFAAVGGQRAFTRVDDWVFDNAGGAGDAGFLRRTPADGTAIRGGRSGRVFLVAGGAPLYVASFAGIGGVRPSTVVDDAAIDQAGRGGNWAFLRSAPEQGTFLRGARSMRVFRVMDSRPLYVASFAPFGGRQPFTDIDDAAIDGCDHLVCDPYGRLDAAETVAGGLRLRGWAHDPNVEGPIAVHVEVDGRRVQTLRADLSRPDVDAYYHRGDRYGYEASVPASRGQRVCVVAVNVGRGADRQLGCATA